MILDHLKELFKFSWSQASSDQNGKSSWVPVGGIYLVVVGGIGFLYGMFLKQADAMMYALGMATLGAGLLGYHKKVDGAPQDLPGTTEEVKTN